MDLKNVASLTYFCPEIVLSATILLIIVLDLLAPLAAAVPLITLVHCLRERWFLRRWAARQIGRAHV